MYPCHPTRFGSDLIRNFMITIISFHFNWCRCHRNNFLCPATHLLKWRFNNLIKSPPSSHSTFRDKLFLEKGPDSRNNPYWFRIWIRRYTQLFWVSYEDAFYPLWVRAYQPETFSHKRRSPKLFKKRQLRFLQTIVQTVSSQRNYVVPYLKWMWLSLMPNPWTIVVNR